jgi:BirA family biotin operon repressor/biotin-[acetyl-CoA-carboxylase] ligase
MAEHASAGAGQPSLPHEHEQEHEHRPGHRHATVRLGAPRLHLRSCDSTNERARALAAAGAPHGTLVTADEQTAGRGRQGRGWLAPPGRCLLCSLVLRGHGAYGARGTHGGLTTPAALLPLVAGVALCDAIGRDARLKWPNDVVLPQPGAAEARADDRPSARLAKVAGILVEGRPQEGWAVVGIGVNVALRLQELPADVRARAATLGLAPSAIEPLLSDLLAALARRLREQPAATLARWRALDALRGREVSWAHGRGRAAGVDDEGHLLVEMLDGAIARLEAGEVHLTGS